MKIGYARVSTADQNLDLQIKALEEAGCEKIFTDKTSGVNFERKGLTEIIEFVRTGDMLVVWKLDRLGRSLQDLINTVNLLQEKDVEFTSISEGIDTTSAGGKLVFHIFGALAEFERELIRERTKAGLAAAKARGRTGGRPRKLNKKQIQMMKKMWESEEYQVKEICHTFDISRSTLYRNIKELEADGKEN